MDLEKTMLYSQEIAIDAVKQEEEPNYGGSLNNVIWKDSLNDGQILFRQVFTNMKESDAKVIKKDKHFEENLMIDKWDGRYVRKI